MVQVKDISTVIRLYYERDYFTNKEIGEIFGTKSTSTITRLKQKARRQMIDDNIPIWDATIIDKDSALKAWHIDIKDCEKRYRKLLDYGFIKPENQLSAEG